MTTWRTRAMKTAVAVTIAAGMASGAGISAEDPPAPAPAQPVATQPAPAQPPAAPAEAPKAAAPTGPLKSPAYIDHADVTPPKESFQYWLDTVTMEDEALAKQLRGLPGYAADQKFSAAELYAERKKRLYMSFDFDAYFDQLQAGRDDDLTPEKRAWQEDQLVRTYLGAVTRDKFAARNIRAINVKEAPDWDKGTARVELDMFSTVDKKDLRYSVEMKLYAKGLRFRWYTSKLIGDVPKEGAAAAAAPASTKEIDKQIADLDAAVVAGEKEMGEMAAKLAKLRAELETKRAERVEAERAANPYGTPELALRTAYAAMKEGSWEKFLSSHTKRVRDAAGDSAKTRFETTAKAKEIGKVVVLETEEDPATPSKIKLKVRLTISSREERKYNAEDGSSAVVPQEERRVATMTFVREDGRWLLDDGL